MYRLMVLFWKCLFRQELRCDLGGCSCVDKRRLFIIELCKKRRLYRKLSRNAFYASSGGNRGRKKLKVYLWSEPFGFEATPEKEKISQLFLFSEEGLAEAIDWMNENYEHIRYKKLSRK